MLPLSFLQEVHRQLHTWRFFIYGAEANDFPVLGWLWTFKVRALADRYGLSVHMDGARVMNAAVAQRVPVSTILQHAHTVSMSLSKVGHEKNTQSRPDWKASHSRCARQGLGAPVGTLLAGPREFIFQAGRCRKVLGGSMRQAGILAAAGKVALLEMAGRLEEDHHNARTFAQGEQGTRAKHTSRTASTIICFFISCSAAQQRVSSVQRRHELCGDKHAAFLPERSQIESR